ncbi:transcription elongation factor A protein-like 1 [Rhynchocyon petersi]
MALNAVHSAGPQRPAPACAAMVACGKACWENGGILGRKGRAEAKVVLTKIPNMEKPPKEKEEPQSSSETPEEPRPVDPSPENRCPEEVGEEEEEEEEEEEAEEEEEEEEDPSSEEPSSSEEESFPEDLLPELLPEILLSEERPPQEHLSRKYLFEERPPMEQPPCGVGKHKLEEGSFKERLARSRPQFRGKIHGKNLSNEEMIKVAEEMEEMKRIRNKLLIMHWKAKRNRPYPV